MAPELNTPQRPDTASPTAPNGLSKPQLPGRIAKLSSDAAARTARPTDKDLAAAKSSRDALDRTEQGKLFAQEFNWNSVSIAQVRTDFGTARAIRVESKLDPATPLYLIDSRDIPTVAGNPSAYAMHLTSIENEWGMILPTASTLPVQQFRADMARNQSTDIYKLRLDAHYAEWAVHEKAHRTQHLVERDKGLRAALERGVGEIAAQVSTAQVFNPTLDVERALKDAARNVATTKPVALYVQELLGYFGGFPEESSRRQQFVDLAPGGKTFASWLEDRSIYSAFSDRAKASLYTDLSGSDLAKLRAGDFRYSDPNSRLVRAMKNGAVEFYSKLEKTEPEVMNATKPADELLVRSRRRTNDFINALVGERSITSSATSIPTN